MVNKQQEVPWITKKTYKETRRDLEVRLCTFGGSQFNILMVIKTFTLTNNAKFRSFGGYTNPKLLFIIYS